MPKRSRSIAKRSRKKITKAAPKHAARRRRELSPVELARATFFSNYRQLTTSSKDLPPAKRRPPFVVLGTADVGQIHFCDAKATYSQAGMETAFAQRMLGIIQTNDPPPNFVNPIPEVLGLEILMPKWADMLARKTDADSADFQIAEAEIARGTWHVGYAAAFSGSDLGLPPDATVYLAGILDGARDDGTVLEVRKTSWDFKGILRQGVNFEKEVQANIYAVLLGMPRWECAFSCKDGIFRTKGDADRERALSEIGHAARLRWGIDTAQGPGPTKLWKCRSSKRDCDFLGSCDVTPIPRDQRQPEDRVLS